MTRVEYSEETFSMRFTGHALSDDYGKDLVCAALSILMYTLVESVSHHREAFLPSILMQDGEVTVRCNPSQGKRTMCRTIMQTVFTGCELLSEQYPQNVETYRLQEGI